MIERCWAESILPPDKPEGPAARIKADAIASAAHAQTTHFGRPNRRRASRSQGRTRQVRDLEQPVAEPAPDLAAGREAARSSTLLPHSGQANDPSIPLVSPGSPRRSRLATWIGSPPLRPSMYNLSRRRGPVGCDVRRSGRQSGASAVQWPISQVSTSESIGFVRR